MRGLTQEAVLERMGSVDSNYAERYSHATVSRWESGGTRPTLQRRSSRSWRHVAVTRREVQALVKERNAAQATIQWRFNTQDARTKLHRLYPSDFTVD